MEMRMEAGTLLLQSKGTHLSWYGKKVCMKYTWALMSMRYSSNIPVQWEWLNSEKMNSVLDFWVIKEYTYWIQDYSCPSQYSSRCHGHSISVHLCSPVVFFFFFFLIMTKWEQSTINRMFLEGLFFLLKGNFPFSLVLK